MSLLNHQPVHNFKKHPSLPEALSAAGRIRGELGAERSSSASPELSEGRASPVEMESPTRLLARNGHDQGHPGFVTARDAWRVPLESYTGWAEP
jgi:hypothetical protein